MGVDGLLLRADQPDRHLAFLKREQPAAAAMAVSVMPSSWNSRVSARLRADDEEPRSVGRGVDVRGLNLPIDFPLFRGKPIEIQLRCRRQCFDDVLDRILVHAVPEVEQQDGHFGVGQELRNNASPREVLAKPRGSWQNRRCEPGLRSGR